MDVVEHLVTVLRTVLDYVGVDLEDLPHPEWFDRRHELSIRYRSLVRLIASLIPPKPARRLHLQPQLIGRCDRYRGSQESLYSTYSDPLDDLDINPDELVWVEEDLGNGCIQMRAHDRKQLAQQSMVEEMDKGLYVLRQFPQRQTSTPINQSLSVVSQTDPGALMKISMLEDELTKLRLQIAQIVIAQENNTLQKSAHLSEAPSVLADEEASDKPGEARDDIPLLDTDPLPTALPVSLAAEPAVCDRPVPSLPSLPLPTPPATPVPAPPPLPGLQVPPPPPPSSHTPAMARTPCLTTAGGLSLSEMLTQKKACLQQREKSTPKGSAPSLSEVLKGLGSVKLRTVQRSPGGTPLREPPKQTPHCDPTFLIAQALKKKFAFRNLHDSLENDKENEFSSSSAESTPKSRIVPGLLKKKLERRRSSLCTDNTDILTHGPGPLRDCNLRV